MSTETKIKQKTRLQHRRRDTEFKDFDDEKEARKHAEDNKLLVVHEGKENDTLMLYYLPE